MDEFIECSPGGVVGSVVDGVALCLEPAGYFSSQPLTAYLIAVSILVAVVALNINQRISRKRATIDFVMHDLSSEEITEAKRVVMRLVSSDTLMDVAKKSETGSEERKVVLRLLNHHEFMAVGVHEGAFDKDLMQRMKHSTTVSTYDKLQPFIQKLRHDQNNKTIFQEFEKLAVSFKRKPLRVSRKEG